MKKTLFSKSLSFIACIVLTAAMALSPTGCNDIKKMLQLAYLGWGIAYHHATWIAPADDVVGKHAGPRWHNFVGDNHRTWL